MRLNSCLICLLVLEPLACLSPAQVAAPLRQAHAHNDYLHDRPLLAALDHGFTSVEADVYLVDGALLVAHEVRELKPERTLEKLYLDPLRTRITKNGGRVYPDAAAFGLLIDIKSEAEATYLALHDVLAKYTDILAAVDQGLVQPGAVRVVISGNRPQNLIAAQQKRYCGIDGRVSDLDSQWPAHLLPMISDNWTKQFQWRGVGPLPDQQRQRLKDIVERAHAQGRSVRFWATPDTPAMWRELSAAQVDLINTDDLTGLEKFLRSQAAASTDSPRTDSPRTEAPRTEARRTDASTDHSNSFESPAKP